ncbi:MAG: zinc metallopeptidase [Eubacteriales bacterium]|jgi:Zn-dependent membrane protease YugP
MYFDWTYVYFVIPAMLVALFAQIKVQTTYKKYSKVKNFKGITGAEAARRVLDANGLGHVRIEQIPGELTDHYDPKTDVIRLSAAVYNSTSTAAIGVACHEAGHAVQHATDYKPAKIRMAIVPATKIGSTIAMILIPVGIILAAIGYYYAVSIAYVGLIGYAVIALFQVITLPTEFNASSRAMAAIKDTGMLTAEEQKGARKVLSAAALTYVAALFATVLTLLRFIVIINNVSGRRR